MAIQPFRLHVPEPTVVDLRERIKRTRWPDELTGSGWTFGTSLSYMKELAGYWLNGFDWRKTEDNVNRYPNFIAQIDGYKIHFLHIKGAGNNSLPLMLLHGWPGSFLEMMKLIPFLSNNPGMTFDLVIPSLMGYGLSQKVTTPGCGIRFMAELFRLLMESLGYKKFGIHGGDFGSGVGTALALKYPRNVIGLHLNNIEGYYKPFLPEGASLTQEEMQFEQESEAWYDREGAYSHQQRTRPLTLAFGLNHSPVGLCAWIIEKFYGWSDCKGDIESVFTRDELLANVTLYWVTQTIHSSFRLYHESRKSPLHFDKDDFVRVPVGIARLPVEDAFPPRKYIERGYNIRRWTEMPAGGHFAAMEQPELLAKDIDEFFRHLNDATPFS
jgi:pimeloyl-ACP methyl ester carboxylesterase